MSTNDAKPSVLKFALTEGGMRGAWRGLVLSEIYTVLFTFGLIVLTIIEGDSTYNPLGVALLGLFYGQFVGVLPSVIVGFIAGLVIARLTIGLKDRDPAVAGKLAVTVALIISLIIDAAIIPFYAFPGQLPYVFCFGLPALIFINDAVQTTKSQLPKVIQVFPPGGVKIQIVDLLYWAAWTTKALVLIAITLGPLFPFF